MNLAKLFVLAGLAASVTVTALFVAPWCAWKFMGADAMTAYGMFVLEVVVTVVIAGVMAEYAIKADLERRKK